MAHQIEVTPSKTYATAANAIKAVEARYNGADELRYFLANTPDGRYFPIFLNAEKALSRGVHFHFNVVG